MSFSMLRPLGDVADFLSGFAWKAKQFSDDPIGMPIIRIQNVGAGASTDFKYWPESYADRFVISRGDLLLTLSGSFRTVVWTGPNALLNQRIVKVSAHADTDTRWLFYALEEAMARIASMGRHALVSNVALSDLKELQINVPPLEEQKRIAGILDQADALRRLRSRALDKLGTLGQAIFHEMFGDPIRNEKGWSTQKLGDVVKIRRGGSPRPIKNYLGGDIPWIKISDGTKGDPIYIRSTAEKISSDGLNKTVHLKKGSLIFANCGVSLGFARIIDLDGCIHDGWLALEDIPETKLNKIFLLKLINFATDHFRRIAPDGTQPNLNTSIMKDFDLILPELERQNLFESKLLALSRSSIAQENAHKCLDNLFASLQHRAFHGEL